MKNLFLLLSFIATVLIYSSCTTSSNSAINVSPSPVLITNPTPVVTNYNVSGIYRANVNGVLFNSAWVGVSAADTERNFTGKLHAIDTFPGFGLTILNYDSVKTGLTYISDVNNPGLYNCGGIIGGIGFIDSAITASSAASMNSDIWHINFSVKTAHHITGTFDFTRHDGMHITNGQIDMSW